MKALGIPFEVVAALDVDVELGSALLWLHGSQSERIHLGTNGDILQAAFWDWPVADIVIAGPPCPPWSSLVVPGARAIPGRQCLTR